jgi:3-deoxy-7-phosphoheptulonate synthase
MSEDLRLTSRGEREDTLVRVGSVVIGGPELVIIAGPCAVESRELIEVAEAVKEAGAHILRGGAFKPRTSPYSFQGLGEEGLMLLAEARSVTGLPVVSEVLAPEEVSKVAEYVDILQIGSRNMQNFPLLKAVGRAKKPVILKRGFAATLEEWLLAAEYIMCQGTKDVILCERGIRTYQSHSRNTLDVAAIPTLKRLTHLPVIADPSHATGREELVEPVARASVAAGADGLMIEVHKEPSKALCDGQQALTPERFRELVKSIKGISRVMKEGGEEGVLSRTIRFY